MLCSLAATAFLAAPSEAQQPVYGGGLRAKPPVQQPMQRPVATFATPFPTRPTPGPVRTVYDQPNQQPQPSQVMPVVQPGAKPVQAPRPGGAATPGAAGKVMYFHKAEGATEADGPPDNSLVAMASAQDVIPTIGIPDVPAAPPGVPQPVIVPATVVEMAIVPPTLDPVPSQPFMPVLPETPPPAFPEPARTVVVQPEEKEKQPDPKPKTAELPPEVTKLPPREAIFTIYDDVKLERIIYASIAEQLKKTPEEVQKQSPFPVLKPAVPAGTPYVAKTVNMPPKQVVYEAGFVIHRRMHFEEKNSERYGWDLGLATPFVSTASFYKNILLWPSSLATSLVVGGTDTNMGKCLPGSPTPYYLYPQGLTITGGVAEGLVITGLSFVIP